MPYLSCSTCRLTVYNPPTVAAPERCPGCGVRLRSGSASLLPPEQPLRPTSVELADALRERASRRGRRL